MYEPTAPVTTTADDTTAAADRIAVVGLGCRFAPDLSSPDELWQFLLDKRCAADTVPEDRWAAHRAHSREHAAVLTRVTPRGAFLTDIAGFDGRFFGISATEARQLDPQQRIALEVAWEALEHAGIPPHTLAGTDASVFMGVGADDYGRRLLEELPEVEAWTGIGAAPCAVANRISYTLDLRGASLTVDTACSSSLVALHQACAALLRYETPLALAGGVMVMAGPGLTTVLDQAGAISKDGRSKPFDAAADGYGRGEGCGIIVLKRLSDARRDNDRVLAVIRGSAVHQDGRTEGIMAPSSSAQEHLLRRAYAAAGVDPREVDYVEAHGTGTKVGDPIEAAALAAVLGHRADGAAPCLIGSVKGNIGHTEAAAGIAGVIKTVLALTRQIIPPTVVVSGPRAEIPWHDNGLRVVTEAIAWPQVDRPRTAGVASYGYGGTIAHVVLEEAPRPDGGVDQPGGIEDASEPMWHNRSWIYPISSATRAGLAAQAARLLPLAASAELGDLGHTLARQRGHLTVRAGVVAADRAELVTGLTALATGGTERSVAVAETIGHQADPVWVFSGHGAQWLGMGRELLGAEPVFAEVIDRIGPIYREEMGLTPRRVLESGRFDSVDVIQAMLVAVQLGLAAVWRRYGVRPGAIIGHSVGEIAAAVTAGVLTEAEGALLACRRSNLLRKVAGNGAMIMVDQPFDDVLAQLGARTDAEAAICAAPSSTVVAGEVDAVDELAAQWPGLGWTIRRVDSDVAFHTNQMEPLAADLAIAVADLAPSPAAVPLYVTAVDDPRSAPSQDAAYWATNLRAPVRFHQAVAAAIADGHRVFVEVSAHPVVSHSILETLSANGIDDGLVLPTLRRNTAEQATLLRSLAALHCRGIGIDWSAAAPAGRLLDLPTNAWQHQRHWVDGPPRAESPVDTLLGAYSAVHGTPVQLWRTTLDFRTRPYPRRHPVLGTEITPAAVLLNTLCTAGSTTELVAVQLKQPVVVPDPAQTRELQVVRDGTALRIVSRPLGADDTAWATHTMARTGSASTPDHASVLETAAAQSNSSLDPHFVVDRLAELGVADMGYPWQIETLRQGETTLFATATADLDRSWAAVLDAALSMASVIFPGPATLRMPAHIDRVTLTGPAPRRADIAVRLRPDQPTTVDVVVAGDDSAATLIGLRYAELTASPGAADDRHLATTRFDLMWQPLAETSPIADTSIVVVESADDTRLVDAEQSADVVFAPPVGTPFDAAAAFAAVVRRVGGVAAERRPRLWALTRGVCEGDTAHAPLWGMGRVAASEHPDFFRAVIDMSADDDPNMVIRTAIEAGIADPVVSVRDGAVFGQRIVAAERERGAAFTCRPDGTYLITGGLGALGLLVAEHLAERGARRIVLLGRRPLPRRAEWSDDDERVAVVRRLENAGVTVRTIAVDITDRAATESALAALDLPPVRGVVHAAGTVDSAMLPDLDPEVLRNVMRPKVDGALVLDELFPPGSIDFLVLFSSAGPLLGLPGQAAYAAANSLLDALAVQRRRAGHRDTVSLAWTSWRGLGMSTSAAATDLELAARGTADLTAEQALTIFDNALAQANSPVQVALTVLRDHRGPRPALLAELVLETSETESTEPDWAELSGPELTDYLLDLVSTRTASTLGAAPDDLNPHRPLTESGIDSLLATALRANLERHLGIPLPATLLWNYPTITDIARYLQEVLRSR